MKKTVILVTLLKIWLIICVIIAMSLKSSGQTTYGNSYTMEKAVIDTTKLKSNGDKYQGCKVYESKNGRFFVVRISKKGNLYKQYLETKKD
jgi:phosphoglucomutase